VFRPTPNVLSDLFGTKLVFTTLKVRGNNYDPASIVTGCQYFPNTVTGHRLNGVLTSV